MKMKLILIILVFLASCGGSGGNSYESPDYSGSWDTSLKLVSNTCPREIPDTFKTLNYLQNLNQNLTSDSLGNQILDVVMVDGIDTYVGVGQLNRHNEGYSFSVTGTPHELPNFLSDYNCIEIIDFNFDAISFLTQNGALKHNSEFVERHSSITCTKDKEIKTCDVTYTGTSGGQK